MHPDEPADFHYRDGFLPNLLVGLMAFLPGCYLTFVFCTRGIPKLVQAQPQGNEWWYVVTAAIMMALGCIVFVGGGLMIMFLQRGATFTTNPSAVMTWHRWLRWEWVRRHQLDGYEAVQVRWRRGKRGVYHYLAVIGKGRRDMPIDTVCLARYVEAEAFAKDVADRLGLAVVAMSDEAVLPSSGHGKA